MRKLIYISIVSAYCALVAQTTGGAGWLTDGGDAQRTGWQKNEKILNKDNVRNLKLIWKLKTDNITRALFSYTPALILDNLPGATKEIAYFVGA
jgi:hypothetical protein